MTSCMTAMVVGGDLLLSRMGTARKLVKGAGRLGGSARAGSDGLLGMRGCRAGGEGGSQGKVPGVWGYEAG